MQENKINFSEEVIKEVKELSELYKSLCSVSEEIQNKQNHIENLLKDQIEKSKNPDSIFDSLQEMLEQEIGEETINKLEKIRSN